MKNISFSMTLDSFKDGSKDVTRRAGWWTLKAGDRLMAVEKAQGLKKGEKVVKLGVIEVVSARVEPIGEIWPADVVREGFPGMTTEQFVAFFCAAHGIKSPAALVTRIEFRRVVSGLQSIDKAAGIERGPDGLPVRLYL